MDRAAKWAGLRDELEDEMDAALGGVWAEYPRECEEALDAVMKVIERRFGTRVHEPVEWGVVPCVDCGKVHFSWYDPSRPGFAPTWKAPADGHSYRPMSAEEFGALMVDKYGVVLERLAVDD